MTSDTVVHAGDAALRTVRALYLDLLEQALTGELQLDADLRTRWLMRCLSGQAHFTPSAMVDPVAADPTEAARTQLAMQDGQFPDGSIASLGFPRTMVGHKRLSALRAAVECVLNEGIGGNFIECGVWRGGASLMMKGVLQAYGDTQRRVILADSFKGLPAPTLPQDAGLVLTSDLVPELAIPRAEVQRGFAAYGLLDDRVEFVEGWFCDTLAGIDTGAMAILRLDGDLYASTKDSLHALYDRLVPGGFLIIDDYGAVPACREAVRDFFAARGEPEPVWQVIDWTGVQARKTA
jgi:hypothetical protein